MNKGKMTVFAVLAAVLLTAAIFIVFLNTTVAGNLSPEISLPPAPSEDPTGGNDSVKIPDVPSFPVEYLDITPENVQSVIKNLRRPENYTIEIEVEYHWSSGSSKVTRRTWGAGGVVRWQQFDLTGNPTINYICTDEAIYVWEEGERVISPMTMENSQSMITVMIPTYEDILGADKADIVSASYEDQNSVPCVKTVIVEGKVDTQRFAGSPRERVSMECRVTGRIAQFTVCPLFQLAFLQTDRILRYSVFRMGLTL